MAALYHRIRSPCESKHPLNSALTLGKWELERVRLARHRFLPRCQESTVSDQHRRVGEGHGWHVDLTNPFEHIAFGFVSGLGKSWIPVVSPFLPARFEAVRPIGDAMYCDGVE
ncbi:MAG: hypothetical protein ABGZ35_09070 [Planctomycetaceae bacterium]